jgi:iron complex outermembrane receptor protein
MIFATLSGQTAHLTGKIIHHDTREPLIGANISLGSTGAVTDIQGNFNLDLAAGVYEAFFSYVGFKTKSKLVNISGTETTQLDIELYPESAVLGTTTVTSGRFEKNLGEETVSLEVLKPNLIESSNKFKLDEALQKVPGVTVIDGQANIRGGSGFSYGAGSRVMLLMDDIPILAADAGFPYWNDIPVENVGQVEVVKGASSALYGSAALNGVINFRTAYATGDPETRISSFVSVVGNPRDARFKWWSSPPVTVGASVVHRQKINKLDLTTSAYYLNENTHNQNAYNHFGRYNLKLRYHINDRMIIGIGTNINQGKNNSFFYWKSDAEAYNGTLSTYSETKLTRFTIDPYVSYFDKKGNRHKILSRFLNIDNEVSNNRSNNSGQYYLEYQFQREFKKTGVVLTAGGVLIGARVTAPLYGDTTFVSRNRALYLDLEKKVGDKLILSGGFRYESNLINNPGFKYPGGVVTPSKERQAKPVFRFGANYRLAEFTHIRATWGQGYRFPTIAEKYIYTVVGGFPVSPNPALTSETGWSSEIGIKQGFKLGELSGFIDLSAFRMHYKDMMEFNFANLTTGFRSINISGVQISGAELSATGQAKIFGCPTTFLGGYLWLDPKFLDFDTAPLQAGEKPNPGQINAVGSSSSNNILKYRSKNSYKMDVETAIHRFSIGASTNHASNIEAIDRTLEFFVPGLQKWRQANNKGYTVYDVRVAYRPNSQVRISFLINNLGNKIYSLRPGLLQPPRNFALRVDWKF